MKLTRWEEITMATSDLEEIQEYFYLDLVSSFLKEI